MPEIQFGDTVQGGFLPLVFSSLFLFMGLRSRISISMLEAKALGVWWKAAWHSRFGITAPFPAAILPRGWWGAKPEAFPCWECAQAQISLQLNLKVDGQWHH